MYLRYFAPTETAPDAGLVAEVEMVFDEKDDPILRGLSMVGIAVRQEDGSVYATLPARGFSAGGKRSYFYYVRGAPDPVAFFKAKVVEGYHAWKASGEPHHQA